MINVNTHDVSTIGTEPADEFEINTPYRAIDIRTLAKQVLTATKVQGESHSEGALKTNVYKLPVIDFTGNELVNDNVTYPLNLIPPPRWIPAATLRSLQEWEGYVLNFNDNYIEARLVDLTAGRTVETEEVQIPIEEISDDDRKKIRIGSIFRWVIGYERSISGTKKRVSLIVFRDLPAITKTDFMEGETWANRIVNSFRR